MLRCRQSAFTSNLPGESLDIMAMAQDIGGSQDCRLISGMAEAMDIATGR